MLDPMEPAHSAGTRTSSPQPALPATAAGVDDAAASIGYAGDIAPLLAWQLVQSGQATLVDVRTAEEVHGVGRVPGARHIEWAKGRDQVRDDALLDQLAEAVPHDRQVLFLCRSGVRAVSAAKAATQAGYRSAWNILQGFEGP